MLGSVMDAEDIVQEAFISYNQLPHPEEIRNERAFLYKIVTNRCLDLLRSSAKKRELYVGPWLPEPLIENMASETDPSHIVEQQESISTAYLLLLQQLNAVERAVFLLREIFHYSYDEIAEILGKTVLIAVKSSAVRRAAFILILIRVHRFRWRRRKSKNLWTPSYRGTRISCWSC
ncbi:sigma-70 family RNA polymerase sigma factor [Paenibacillus sp. 843]